MKQNIKQMLRYFSELNKMNRQGKKNIEQAIFTKEIRKLNGFQEEI